MNFKKALIPGAPSYKILIAISAILLTSAIGGILVLAGSLNPPAAPADTDHTLDDIYHKLDKNAGVPATYGIDSPVDPAATMHTLSDIWDKTPAYLDSPAAPSDVCNSKYFYANPASGTATKQQGTRTAEGNCHLCP